jgi:small-conductance mechanosensitive channel
MVRRRAAAVLGSLLVIGGGLLVPAVSRAGGPAENQASPAGSEVHLRGQRLFPVRTALNGHSAEERARATNEALAAVLEKGKPAPLHVQQTGESSATIFVGTVPVLELGREDAAAAGAPSLAVHAAALAQTLDRALRAEERRRTVQALVLNVSLAVFLGLIAFLAIRKLGNVERGLERWLDDRPQGAPPLRVRDVELASPRAVRGAFLVALRLGRLVGQVLLAYLWILAALFLLSGTSEVGQRITKLLLAPVGRLLARMVAVVPQLLALAIFTVLLFLLLRGVRLFFGSVARGETHLRWLPADLARPTSALLQGALVLLAILSAGPVITGGDTGPFQRLALAVLVAAGVACAPLFAAVVAGLPLVYGRSLRVGEVAEIGGRVGLVKQVNLLSVVLEDAEGRPVRIPHLISLFRPIRLMGPAPLGVVEVTVDADGDPKRVQEILLGAAGSHASGARVELVALDARGARYRTTSSHPDLGNRVASALADAGVRLAALDRPGGREGA